MTRLFGALLLVSVLTGVTATHGAEISSFTSIPVDSLHLTAKELKAASTVSPAVADLLLYTLPGNVRWMSSDPLDKLALIGCENYLLCFDLAARRFIWATKGKIDLMRNLDDCFLLRKDGKEQRCSKRTGQGIGLIRSCNGNELEDTGKYIRWLEYYFDAKEANRFKNLKFGTDVMRSYYELLRLNPSFSRDPLNRRIKESLDNRVQLLKLDGLVGSFDIVKWSRAISVARGDTYYTNQQLYVIKNGIERIDLETGEGSFIFLEGEENAGFRSNLNLYSNPVFDQDKIYFCAKDVVVKCDELVSSIEWMIKLDVHLSWMDMLDAGENLLLVYKGFGMNEGELRSNGYACARLIDKKTGTVLSQFDFASDDVILKSFVLEDEIFFLANKNFYQMTKDLQLKTKLSSKPYGDFLRIHASPLDHKLIQSQKGLLCLDEKNLSVAWWLPLGDKNFETLLHRFPSDKNERVYYVTLQNYRTELTARAGYFKKFLTLHDYASEFVYSADALILDGIDKIIVVDVRTGKLLAEMELQLTEAPLLVPGAYVLSTMGNRLMIYFLDKSFLSS